MATLLHICVLFLLMQLRQANAEPTALQVDPSALNDLMEEEHRNAREVIKRVETIRRATPTNNQSKFTKMKELFGKAKAISPGEFKGEVAFGGQCVTQDNQETFYPGLANLYVDRDPVLGTQIYFVPAVGEGSSTDPDYANLDVTEMRRIHQKRRSEKVSFTAMQFGLGENSQLSEILSATLKNSVLFTYRPPRSPASQSAGKSQSSMVLFNVRMDRAPSGRPYVIMQRLCPYFPGCKPQGNNLAEYLNYVDAFAYCYYTTMNFLPKGG